MQGKLIVLFDGKRWEGEASAHVSPAGAERETFGDEIVKVTISRSARGNLVATGTAIRRAVELGARPVASFTPDVARSEVEADLNALLRHGPRQTAPIQRMLLRVVRGWTEGDRDGWHLHLHCARMSIRGAVISAPGPVESPLLAYLTHEEREALEADAASGRYDIGEGDAGLLDVALYLYRGEYTADLIERAREAGYRGAAERADAAVFLRRRETMNEGERGHAALQAASPARPPCKRWRGALASPDGINPIRPCHECHDAGARGASAPAPVAVPVVTLGRVAEVTVDARDRPESAKKCFGSRPGYASPAPCGWCRGHLGLDRCWKDPAAAFEEHDAARREALRWMHLVERVRGALGLEEGADAAQIVAAAEIVRRPSGCSQREYMAAVDRRAAELRSTGEVELRGGATALWLGWPTVLDRWRARVASHNDERPPWEHVARGGVLVLDDLGIGNATAWNQERLYQAVEELHPDAVLVATSNLTPRELAMWCGARAWRRIEQRVCVIGAGV